MEDYCNRIKNKKRIVIKVGSSTLTHKDTGNLNYAQLEKLVRAISNLKNSGKEVILVSSGAVAVGRETLKIGTRPKTMPEKQACAAIGQCKLMMNYYKLFAEYGQIASQVLMTKYSIDHEKSYENLQNALLELLKYGSIPIVNENDAIATDEIEFGENDTLSAMVASIVNADLLILLTDTDGLYTDDPFKNENAKFRAIVEEIKESHKKGQPVLVGTVSIEKSEKLSKLLKKAGIPHEVLNAKFHEKEAEIIAQAGKFGAVTIATNMAGRGTDIMLGGNTEYMAKQEMKRQGYSNDLIVQSSAHNETKDEEVINARKVFAELEEKFKKEIQEEKEKVIDAGGLKIIGTERHESRRIDNQLRGRSGRQGDPGESIFYIGLDDDLMKLFGGDTVSRVYNALGADENMPIQFKPISKAVESAQKKVESRNFSIRKHVLSYDDVMNTQRELIYTQRREVLDGEDVSESIQNMIRESCNLIVDTYRTEIDNKTVNKESLLLEIQNSLNIKELDTLNKDKYTADELLEELQNKALEAYKAKEEEIGTDAFKELQRIVLLKVVDEKWMDHIDDMDELKNGIGLRAYGQKDPVIQYKIDGSDMFEEMINAIKLDVTKIIMCVKKREGYERKSTVKITGEGREDIDAMINPELAQEEKKQVKVPIVNDGPKVGRNDLCPCGSGKKYKNCCGKNN